MTKSLATLRVGRPSRLPLQAVEILGVSALAICVGIAVAKSSYVAEALIPVALLCLYAWYATTHPRGAVIALFVSLTLLPVYIVPSFRSFSPEPTAVGALVLVLVFARERVQRKITVVDAAFTAICSAMVLAALIGTPGLRATLSNLFLWIPPYLVGRAICRREQGPKVFALAAAVGGLVALPFIAYETITGSNPFFGLAYPGSILTKMWAHPALRAGFVRSQGAFGHPLSMAIVMGSCAVFAVGLALRTRVRARRVGWLFAALGLAVGQNASDERSGWIVLIGGLLMFAATAIPRETRVRHGFTVAMVCVPLALVAVSATQASTLEAASDRAGSNADRLDLWRHALEPGAFAVFGLPETETFNYFVNAVKPGQTAIDSAYLQIGDVYGLIAFLAFLTVVAAVVRVAVAVRGTWAALIPAVAFANLIALTVVGFQTQIPIFAWLTIGAASGVDIRRRSMGIKHGHRESQARESQAWPTHFKQASLDSR